MCLILIFELPKHALHAECEVKCCGYIATVIIAHFQSYLQCMFPNYFRA